MAFLSIYLPQRAGGDQLAVAARDVDVLQFGPLRQRQQRRQRQSRRQQMVAEFSPPLVPHGTPFKASPEKDNGGGIQISVKKNSLPATLCSSVYTTQLKVVY